MTVALSGGVDSTVLLHATVARVGSGVRALHVDHQTSEASAEWRDRCEQTCVRLGVSFQAVSVDVDRRGSFEAAARRARYGVFRTYLESGGEIWLAHNSDDAMETLWLRLLQGREVRGMPRKRPLGRGWIRRPLLDVSRTQIVEYARRAQLNWIEDPSNRDLHHDRNYVRHRLRPMLRARFPASETQLQRFAVAAAERDRAMRTLVGSLCDSDGTLPVDAVVGSAQGPDMLRVWLGRHGVFEITGRALEAFVSALQRAGPDRQPTLQVAQGAVRRYRDRVYWVDQAPEVASHYPILGPGIVQLPHGKLVIQPTSGPGFELSGTLAVVFRKGGDRVRSGDRSRSLKTLFQSAGVPPWDRATYPLIAVLDGASRSIVAVPGLMDGERGAGDRYVGCWQSD